MPFTGPTVERPSTDAIDEAGLVLSDLVLGSAFFSDAREPEAGP